MACALAALLVLAGAGTATAQEELEDYGNYEFSHEALGLGPVAMFLQGDADGFRNGWVEEGEQLYIRLLDGTYELDIFATDVVSAEPLATASVTLEVNRRTAVRLRYAEGGALELVTESTVVPPSLSATYVPVVPGEEIGVTAAHFPPGSLVEVTFGQGERALRASGRPDSGGVFEVRFTVPAHFAGPPGSTTSVPISATVLEGGTGSASTTIDVVAPAGPPTPSARPRVTTPSRIEAGGGGAARDGEPVPMAMVGVLGGVAAGIAVLGVVRRSAR
jgi:hypothetical protein